jgi:acetolactate synthase-1/2/3 large subunit
VAHTLLDALEAMGVQRAFGVMGGALVPFYSALLRSSMSVVHFRHESGAAFAATEASLAAGAPTLVFATTGPGLTNALTGTINARWEGAKIVLVSGTTPRARRGRFALQESHERALGACLYGPNGPFDEAASIDDPAELPRVIHLLERGFSSRRGFVAHLGIPLHVQAARAPCRPTKLAGARWGDIAPSTEIVDEVLARLREPFALWLGFGARHAAGPIRALAERTGAPVIATPRGKGIFPEDHPRYLGTSGAFGGDPDLARRLQASKVSRLLVLGSRLGEVSTAYLDDLIPPRGLVHVDLDPEVFGGAFPGAETFPVHAEIEQLVTALLPRLGPEHHHLVPFPPRKAPERLVARREPRVRPELLMHHVQSRIVEGSDSVLLSESGNAFAWTARHLRFSSPGRYRQSGLFCPMGHASAGVVGAALATGRRAVAVVGDGALLMQNEINTAVATGAKATWIVLNDARYGMVDQGLARLGCAGADLTFPEVDFAALARALGARGATVSSERDLPAGLEESMGGEGPFVLDVHIDPSEPAPFGDRLRSIDDQTHCPGGA